MQSSPACPVMLEVIREDMRMKWFAFDRINGDFDLFNTESEAKACAAANLEIYQDMSSDDGWPEGMEGAVGYGPIKSSTQYTITAERADYTAEDWAEEGYGEDWEHIAKCELVAR